MLPWQPIKFSDLNNIYMNRIVEDYSRNISVGKNLNICSETAKIATFHFSHYKSMETIRCHSNKSSYPIGTKTKNKQTKKTKSKNNNNKKQNNYSFPPPIDAICEIWKASASEEKAFENADGRTTDACLYYKLTP